MSAVRVSISTRDLWMAAAWGHCRNGDHVAEFKCRDIARLCDGKPPLTDKARCLVQRGDPVRRDRWLDPC